VSLARGFLRVRGTGRRGTRMMLMRRGLWSRGLLRRNVARRTLARVRRSDACAYHQRARRDKSRSPDLLPDSHRENLSSRNSASSTRPKWKTQPALAL